MLATLTRSSGWSFGSTLWFAPYCDSVPHYPGEDEKLRADSLVQRRGGNGPNTLEVLQQLVERHQDDVQLFLCSVLPSRSSEDVRIIQSSLGKEIQLSSCIFREQQVKAASSYIVRSISTGSRTIVNFNTLDEMTCAEVSHAVEQTGEDIAVFHFEGRIPDVSLECIRWLRKTSPHATISVELEKPGRPGLQAMAAEADIVFHSKTWAQHEGFQNAEACLRAQRSRTKAKLLFCSWGERGAYGLDREPERFVHCPAYLPPGSKVLDSVGAGDTFVAGILYRVISGQEDDLAESLRFAVQLAGTKVAQEGLSGLFDGP